MTGLEHHPCTTAVAAAATDDDPDDSVSPAPRSHTSTARSWSAVHANELDVRPLGESRVCLHQRAESEQVGPCEIYPSDDRMGIPN